MQGENGTQEQAQEQTETETPEAQEQEQALEEAAPEAGGDEAEARTDDAAAEEGADEEAAEGDAEPDEKRHRRKGGWERKVERLQRQLEERDALLHRVLGTQPQPQTQTPPAERPPEQQAAEYVQNLVRQEIATRDAQAQFQRTAQTFAERAAAERAKHEDFDDVVAYADIPTQSPLGVAILTSEHGPAIMYQLAKNPAELARLSALPPVIAAREIGRLEAKLASSTAAPRPKSVTRPPPPPTTVRGGAKSTQDLESLDIGAYKRAMRSRGG